MCDRNVKSEYVLIKLRALVSEYICERTTKFHEKTLFDSCDARQCRPENKTNYDIKYFIKI